MQLASANAAANGLGEVATFVRADVSGWGRGADKQLYTYILICVNRDGNAANGLGEVATLVRADASVVWWRNKLLGRSSFICMPVAPALTCALRPLRFILPPLRLLPGPQVSDYMRAAIARGEQYDMVVLDPPKLAPDRNSLGRAKSK